MRIIYEDAARQEGMEAAAWYEQQQQGLGTRFLTQWKNAENRMVANPEIHRCIQGELRKCRFVIFPYALVFRTRGDDLQVLAIMHMRRKPGYWNKRD
jgi:plasmid stabilization system protein ParE